MIDHLRHVTPDVGERVVVPHDGEAGEVIEVIRQRHTDDLLRVHWDSDTEGEDRDLYSWASLTRELVAARTSGTKKGSA